MSGMLVGNNDEETWIQNWRLITCIIQIFANQFSRHFNGYCYYYTCYYI